MSFLNSLASSRQLHFARVLPGWLLYAAFHFYLVFLFDLVYMRPLVSSCLIDPWKGLGQIMYSLFRVSACLWILCTSHQETAMEQDSTKGNHDTRRGRADFIKNHLILSPKLILHFRDVAFFSRVLSVLIITGLRFTGHLLLSLSLLIHILGMVLRDRTVPVQAGLLVCVVTKLPQTWLRSIRIFNLHDISRTGLSTHIRGRSLSDNPDRRGDHHTYRICCAANLLDHSCNLMCLQVSLIISDSCIGPWEGQHMGKWPSI